MARVAVDDKITTLRFKLGSSQLFHNETFLLRITFNSAFF